MFETIEKEKINSFKNNLSKCVNVTRKAFTNKQLIISNFSRKNLIGFITYGKASIIKTDINGNTTIMRELKEDDIFSNLFFQHSEDEIYIISNNQTEVIFIDYYNILYFLKQRMNKDNVFKVTTSYKAIAEYIVVDRSNLMRELNKLEKDGLIKRDKNTIYIK